MSEVPRKVVATTPTRPLTVGEEAPRAGRIELFLDGVRIHVSPEMEAAVHRELARERARRDQGVGPSELEVAVHRATKESFHPLPKEMTTTQAAEFLDVSRPFVIKLIKRGELPCRMVGKHRRIPGDALLAYREKMFQRAKSAADEMAQASQELGLYELEGPPPKAR